MKECKGCGVLKPVEEYHKASHLVGGRRNKCKECVAAYMKSPSIVLAQSNYAKTLKGREIRKTYASTDAGKETARKSHRASKEKNPERKAARVAVHKAVARGSLAKLPCWVCGSVIEIEGHHADYSAQLDVVWLCKKHHDEIHYE